MPFLLLTWALLASIGDQPYLAWTTETVAANELPATIGELLTPNDLARLLDSGPKLPYADPTCGIRLPDGTLWVGSKRGLMYRAAQQSRWRLFHSRRWLPSNEVTAIAVDQRGAVWTQTPAGIAKIARVETTLDQKMARIDAELRKRHLREGLVATISGEPGQLDQWQAHSDDNDGLWTSIYVAAEAFRYGATQDPAAKANAWQSLKTLMLLEEVTGIPGFVARSIYPASVDFNPAERHGGQWQRSPDGRWWWKGDTSSDELDGHYFAYSIYYDVAATPDEREEIKQHVARITDHIIDHGFYYVGPGGKPTRWGVWAPERLNHDLKWIGDRGLNSLEILSHLKVAEHVVGDPKYAAAAKELIETHGYLMNTVLQKLASPPEIVNHSDDELAFLAYYPLLWYERDPQRREAYLTSLERSWRVERPEHSPLFNYIYAAGRQADFVADPSQRPERAFLAATDYDNDANVEWFREVPEDLTLWSVANSDRQDLGELLTNRFDRKRSRMTLPIAERPVMKWNGDPYELDGGADGRARDDGAFILLPYWMGRYHRFLD